MAVKYKWLAGRLREMIYTNIEKGIPQLPTEHELCRRYHVSRQTVRSSLDLLEADGLICRRQGSGCYITGLSDIAASNKIAILVPYEQEYLYPHLLHNLEVALSSYNLDYDVYLTRNRHDLEREILLTLLSNPSRGLLVYGVKTALPNPNLALYERLLTQNTRIVFIQDVYPSLLHSFHALCSVTQDVLAGMNTLFSHLHALGHKRIGCVLCMDNASDHLAFSSFVEAYYNHELHYTDDAVFWLNSKEYDTLLTQPDFLFSEKKIQELLNSCTCVICRDDLIAYCLIHTLEHLKLNVPHQFSVCALNHTYLSHAGSHFIAGIAPTPHEFGASVASLLMDQLKGLPASSHQLSGHFVVGNTTSHPEI